MTEQEIAYPEGFATDEGSNPRVGLIDAALRLEATTAVLDHVYQLGDGPVMVVWVTAPASGDIAMAIAECASHTTEALD